MWCRTFQRAEPGTFVVFEHVILATDGDPALQARITYTIAQDKWTEYFGINETSGAIFLIKKFPEDISQSSVDLVLRVSVFIPLPWTAWRGGGSFKVFWSAYTVSLVLLVLVRTTVNRNYWSFVLKFSLKIDIYPLCALASGFVKSWCQIAVSRIVLKHQFFDGSVWNRQNNAGNLGRWRKHPKMKRK